VRPSEVLPLLCCAARLAGRIGPQCPRIDRRPVRRAL